MMRKIDRNELNVYLLRGGGMLSFSMGMGEANS